MASGDTLSVWRMGSAETIGDNTASADIAEAESRGSGTYPRRVRSFVASGLVRRMFLSGHLSRRYAGGGIGVIIHWISNGATSGDVVWNVAIDDAGDTATDHDTGYASVISGENTVTATTHTTDGVITSTIVTFTDGADMDSIAAGDQMRIMIERDHANAADTMNSNDAQVICVELVEL